MTQNIQISGKADNGTIFVVGGEDFTEFTANLLSVFEDPSDADAVLAQAKAALLPSSAPGQALHQAQANVQAQMLANVVPHPSQAQQQAYQAAPTVPAGQVTPQHVTPDGKILLNVDYNSRGQIKAMGGFWNSDTRNPWTGKKGCWSVNPNFDSHETVQQALNNWGS